MCVDGGFSWKLRACVNIRVGLRSLRAGAEELLLHWGGGLHGFGDTSDLQGRIVRQLRER
jgi:hypothetical protein